jgi:hypothetical protein
VVSCAEGDWHSLAAEMLGESLRGHGVGGDSLAVSCSMAMFFLGASRLADAAHRQGVPVIMGGRPFGDDSRRALALGAVAWAGSPGDAAAVLAGWKAEPPRIHPAPVELPPEGLRLAAEAEALGGLLMSDLVDHLPAVADLDPQQRRSVEQDLTRVVHTLAAAVLVDEAAVLGDFLAWLQVLFASRGVLAQVLPPALDALRPLVHEVAPAGVAMLESGRRALVPAG